MWTCQCQTKNKLRSRTCTACHSPVPPEELKRIYKYELTAARKEIGFDFSNSSVLKKLDEYVDSDDKSFFEILCIIALFIAEIGVLIYKNIKKILPYASIVAVIVCVISLSNPYNKHILRQKREVSTARRSVIAENMEYKVSGMGQNLSDFAKLQKITLNGEELTKLELVNQRIDLAKETLGGYIKPVTDSVGDFIDDILSQIKEMTGIYNTKEGF